MSGRILIIESLATNRALLKSKLDAAYYDVQATGNAAEAMLLARHDQPDLILLSTGLANVDGLQICKMLTGSPDTMHIPVILICDHKGIDALKGFNAGADDILERPFDDFTLKIRVRNLIRMKRMLDELRLRDDTARDLGLEPLPQPKYGFCEDAASNRVLLMPRSASEASSWQRHLAGVGVEAVIAWSEREAMAKISGGRVQVAVLQKKIAQDGDGLRLVSHLNSQDATKHLGIIFVADADDPAAAAEAIDLGASDFITAPINLGELAGRVRCQLRRKRVSDGLRANLRDDVRASFIDPLTRLFNRRYAESHLPRMVKHALHERQNIAIMMMDLDHFKQVNDRFGHGAGDTVLRSVAQRLTASLRNEDMLARFGGEEFFIAMPNASLDGATQIAERVRKTIETRPFLLSGGDQLNVTISIGVAIADPAHPAPIHDVLEKADKALYSCKAAGRNCVRIHQEAA